MSSVITFGILLGLLQLCRTEPACHLNEVMQCVSLVVDYLKALPRGSLLESDEAIDDFCWVLEDAMSCATDFRDKCMTPIQKELLMLVQGGPGELKESLCTAGSSLRSRFLYHAGCLNEVEFSERMALDKYYVLAFVEKLISSPSKSKIHYMCCGYQNISNTMLSHIEEVCGKDAYDVVDEIIFTLAAQLPDIVCGNVKGSEKSCSALLPPKGAKPTNELKGSALYQFVKDAFTIWID